MTLAKVKERGLKRKETRWDDACKSKSPKHHYIGGLLQRLATIMQNPLSIIPQVTTVIELQRQLPLNL